MLICMDDCNYEAEGRIVTDSFEGCCGKGINYESKDIIHKRYDRR